MILYDNRDVRFIFFKKAGSVLISRLVLLPAFLSSGVCAAVLIVSKDTPIVLLSSSVARVYATILGFVIVFRTSMAFGRFYEGVAHVQMMFSKWRDAFTSLVSFIECSVTQMAKREDVDLVEELLLSKARLLHWFSLLSALSVQELQVGSSGSLNQDSDGEESYSRICILAAPTDRMHAPPGNGRTSGLAAQLESLYSDGDKRAAPSGAAPAKSKDSFRSSLSGGGLLWSGRQFEANLDQWRRSVHVVGEITPDELDQIDRAHDHVLTVIKWILVEVSEHAVSGRLLIAPPILSRVYQELSNGMLAFFMAKMKISMVPFPFPFAQVLSYALYAFYVFCPFIILETMQGEDKLSLEQIGVPLLLNFAACMGYAAVNEIAIELEEPFGFDINDYPVHSQQNLIVRAMEDTYFTEAPNDFVDSIDERGVNGVWEIPPPDKSAADTRPPSEPLRDPMSRTGTNLSFFTSEAARSDEEELAAAELPNQESPERQRGQVAALAALAPRGWTSVSGRPASLSAVRGLGGGEDQPPSSACQPEMGGLPARRAESCPAGGVHANSGSAPRHLFL